MPDLTQLSTSQLDRLFTLLKSEASAEAGPARDRSIEPFEAETAASGQRGASGG